MNNNLINKNNIFVSTTFAKDGEKLSKIINECLNAGLWNLELGSNHCFEKNYNYLKDYNFRYLVHNYFPIPKEDFIVNIASLNDEIRIRSINHIKSAIKFSDHINAKLYTFHPGFLIDPITSNLTEKNYDFHWRKDKLVFNNFEKAKSKMYESLDYLIDYATSFKVKIAIETEGSFNKKNYLLMQRPEEFEEFKSKYNVSEIGINLNIGHLYLASNAFNFDKLKFVDLIEKYIVAMELSHNDGVEDQHLPLVPLEWYWILINDNRFSNIYKIIEFRNTKIKDIINNIKLINCKLNSV